MSSLVNSIVLLSLIIIVISCLFNPKNKVIKYALMILVVYVLNLILIGFNTAQQTCLPGKSKTSTIISQSIWPALFGVVILGMIQIPFLKGFFVDPFVNLAGQKYGIGLAEGLNLAGISWAGASMTYFNVRKNGCQA